MMLLVLDPSTKFSYVSWSVLWLCHQIVTDVTLWPINPNPSYSKNRKLKNKLKRKIKNERKNKINQVHLLWSWQVVHFVIYILSENIKNRGVRIENNGLGFYFILFFFYFSFIFLFSFLLSYIEKGQRRQKCDTITSHMIQSQIRWWREECRSFQNRMMSFNMVTTL